jgi:putative flippase GtrA
MAERPPPRARPPARAAVVALRYALFAAVATAANLLVQWATLRALREAGATLVSLAAGTAVGLLVKYALDAPFVFGARLRCTARELLRLLRYGATGVVTTALFWAVELAAVRLAPFPGARYAGGAIGLAAGYAAKYALDARFVFRDGG